MVRIGTLLGLWLLTTLPALAAVSASVDKNPVLVGETLTLTISSEDGDEEPDLSVLENDFQILGRSTSSQFQIINGVTQRSHDWNIQLRPLREGALTIPPISLGQETTAAIALQVERPQQAPDELPEAFIEFSSNKDSVYVREQLILTSRLFVRGQLVSGNLSDPQSDHAVIEQIGEQSESQALKGNHRYRVIERRYAAFPEQSGPLSIEPPLFNGEVASGQQRRTLFGFSNATRAIAAGGDPITLKVKPQPASFAGANWLPASELQLSDELSPAQGPYRTGEPLTRTIRLQADGQLHTHLPDLDIPVPTATQSYTEAPQDQTRSDGLGLSALREYSVAVIPNQTGALELPELQLQWWDTDRDEMRTTTMPARTIRIAAAPGAAGTPAPTISQSGVPVQAAETPTVMNSNAPVWPWQVATITAIAGWLGTLLIWFLRSRPRQHKTDDGPDLLKRRQLIRALQQDDAIHCRQALLKWARHQFGSRCTLLDLARHSDDPEFSPALQALDQAAFGPGKSFPREPLIRFAREFRYAAAPAPQPALKPLYPESY